MPVPGVEFQGTNMTEFYGKLKEAAASLTRELIEKATLTEGDVLVVGCSSSEVAGERIGTSSSYDVARAVFGGIYSETSRAGVFLAAQCCEHLNRALIVEKALAKRDGLEIVNAVPQPKAGGSFATAAYESFASPAAVEAIKADAGLDIGDTLIGMHLKAVAVPLRLSVNSLGEAHLTAARTRAKFVGGSRAVYDAELM